MFDLRHIKKANVLSYLSHFVGQANAISINSKVRNFTFAKKFGRHLLFFYFLFVCLATPLTNAVWLNDWIFNIGGTVFENFYSDPIPTTGAPDHGLGSLSMPQSHRNRALSC
jgi:hypothetical protein